MLLVQMHFVQNTPTGGETHVVGQQPQGSLVCKFAVLTDLLEIQLTD